MMADPRDEKSLGDLFSELAGQTTALVRQEIKLAKVELGQKASQAGKDVGLIGLGGAVAYAGLLAVLAGVILALGNVIPVWMSALIVGVVALAVGYFLSQQHLNALRRLDAIPHATIETLKEDKEWAKEQMR
jgi:uncharacterized membrane protein YqjE